MNTGQQFCTYNKKCVNYNNNYLCVGSVIIYLSNKKYVSTKGQGLKIFGSLERNAKCHPHRILSKNPFSGKI